MDDVVAMRGRGAGYVILHKVFEAQFRGVASSPPDLDRLWGGYVKTPGAPAYGDEHMAVFRR